MLEQLREGRPWGEVFGNKERTQGHALDLSDESGDDDDGAADAERAGAGAPGAAAPSGERRSVRLCECWRGPLRASGLARRAALLAVCDVRDTATDCGIAVRGYAPGAGRQRRDSATCTLFGILRPGEAAERRCAWRHAGTGAMEGRPQEARAAGSERNTGVPQAA